jgi:hypothetical protein
LSQRRCAPNDAVVVAVQLPKGHFSETLVAVSGSLLVANIALRPLVTHIALYAILRCPHLSTDT